MIHHFGPLRGEIDGSLHDDTTYWFADERSGDRLTLTYERTPEGVALGGLVAAKLEGLSAVYGPAFEVVALEDVGTRVGPAACASARLVAAVPTTVCLAYVGREPLYLQFSGDESTPSLLRHVLDSLSYDDDSNMIPAPGFVRGAAGALAFDMPSSYSMPDTFRFSRESIVLECAIQKGRDWRAPTASS